MQSVIITKNQAGQRLDKFLRKYLPEAGSSFLYKMLRKKNITLNDTKAEGKEMLAVGDKVCFFFSDETFEKFSGRKLNADDTKTKEGGSQYALTEIAAYQAAYRKLKAITVLYEDEDVLFVNKPAGILTQKAAPTDLSLNEWLVGYLLETNAISTDELHTFHPSVCNRLDRNTSGIVLCGKTLAGSQLLSRVIKERTVRKFYRTICVGRLTEDKMLEGYLVKDAATNKVTVSRVEENVCKSKEKHNTENRNDTGAYIKTAYHPLKATDKYTLLEVELITGKAHQIRAHLASIGHPIIGDYKYGNVKVNNQLKMLFDRETAVNNGTSLKLDAQLLHAYMIAFPVEETLPESLRGRVVTAPYPVLFERMLEGLNLN